MISDGVEDRREGDNNMLSSDTVLRFGKKQGDTKGLYFFFFLFKYLFNSAEKKRGKKRAEHEKSGEK